MTVKALMGTAALLAALAPAPGHAKGEQVNVFWGEDDSCSAWMKSAGNKAVRAYYDFWMRGFVSGYNFGNPARQIKVGAFPGSNDLYQYLDRYCRDNPKLSFVGGAIELVAQLREASAPARKEAAKAAPKPVK